MERTMKAVNVEAGGIYTITPKGNQLRTEAKLLNYRSESKSYGR